MTSSKKHLKNINKLHNSIKREKYEKREKTA
jgi:hypothetical protein